MADPGWKDALVQFRAVVTRLSDSCTQEAEAPDGVVTRGSWAGNADRIENLLPKFTLAFRDQPAKNMCQPLAELLIQALMDQVALSQLMATQCSRLVADAIRVSVRLLLEAVDDLAAALVKENEAAASGSGDKRPNKGCVTTAFGVATKLCTRVKECPLDTHRAAAGELQGAARLIKDAMKELQEMQQWEDKEDDEANGDQEWDAFDDLGDEKLNDDERKMVVSCEQLLRGSGALMEKVATLLTRTAPSIEASAELARSPLAGPCTAEREDAWALSLTQSAKGVQERVDELASILYEFDVAGVGSAANNLLKAVDVVIEVVMELPAIEKAHAAGMDMAKVFAVVRRICDEAVKQLQASAPS